MPFFTLNPTPVDGGTFDHNSERFDWCALTDTKFLIVYNQTNPGRVFAQVVNFNGDTTAPSFGAAFVVGSENINDTFPMIVAISSTRAVLAYNATVSEPTAQGLYALAIKTLEVDVSDQVTILDTIPGNAVEHGRVGMDYHAGSDPLFFRTIYEAGSLIAHGRFTVNSTTGIFTPFVGTVISSGLDNNTGPYRVMSDPNGTPDIFFNAPLFSGVSDDENDNVFDATGYSSTFRSGQTMERLTTNTIISTVGTDLRVYERGGLAETNFQNVLQNPCHHSVRIDDEHVFLLEGITTSGNAGAYVFRITSEGGFNYIANANHPLSITNSVITKEFVNSNRTDALYYNSSNNLIHATGILDDGGTNKIGFHIFTP